MTYKTRTLETLEIVGGSLCLDFTNTINSRHKPEHDYLAEYSDLVNWAVKVGYISVSQGRRLQRQAKQDEANAQAALQKAVSLRELLYRLLSKLANRSEPPREDMETFVKFYAQAISYGVFLRKGDSFAVDWELDANYDAILWPITYSAGQLLLSGKLVRVKECPNCGWLFVDTSKNRNRRWCSMNTCGVRDKMRRYHRKLRG